MPSSAGCDIGADSIATPPAPLRYLDFVAGYPGVSCRMPSFSPMSGTRSVSPSCRSVSSSREAIAAAVSAFAFSRSFSSLLVVSGLPPLPDASLLIANDASPCGLRSLLLSLDALTFGFLASSYRSVYCNRRGRRYRHCPVEVDCLKMQSLFYMLYGCEHSRNSSPERDFPYRTNLPLLPK